MKGRATIAVLVLLTVSALASYVLAQVPANAESYQKAKALKVIVLNYRVINNTPVGNGAKSPVTVCTGPTMATDGSAKCLYQALPASGILRIEMQDGTVQEIDLGKVKGITVQ